MSDGNGVGHNDHQVNLAGLEFCPRCSSPLETKEIRGHERLVCASCGYIFYMTPAPVTCAIVRRDRTILLVRRKYPPQAGKWCLPAGFVETREHPEESARREIKEETGLDVKIEDIFDTWASEEDPRTPVVAFAFTATVVGGDLRPGDDADRAEFFDETSLPPDIAFDTHRAAIAKYFGRLRRP